jgi:molecular chaperone GrpE
MSFWHIPPFWQAFCVSHLKKERSMTENNETLHTDQVETALPDVPDVSETTEPSEPADEKIAPIDQLTTDLKEANDKYLRLYSDFDNFRKRNLKERLELIKTASESVILSLLPILDDFDRALPSIQDEAIKAGIELIYSKFKTTLENQGLKAMETKDVAFDADLHEAIAQTPSNDDAQKGLVIDEIQRGYYLNDKVIRHAKVIVAN